MIGLAPLLLLGVIGVVVYLATHRSPGGAARADGVPPGPAAPRAAIDVGIEEPASALARWVGAGLVSAEQRDAILSFERSQAEVAPPPPSSLMVAHPRRIPAVAEALGYLGGMLAVIGLLLVVAQYWPDMATGFRLLLAGAATGALLGAGAAVPEQADPAWARLRWFLWLAATATAAIFAGVVSADGLDASPDSVVLAAAATVAGLSLVLWRGLDRPVQQLTALVGGIVAVGALVAEVGDSGPVGVAVWVAGAALLAVGLRRVIRTTPLVTVAVGSGALLVGALIVVTEGPTLGLLLAVSSALGLLAVASIGDLAPERADRIVLVVVGGVALLQAGPSSLAYFSQEAGGLTGLATWATGAVVLGLGARRLVRWPLPTELLGGLALLGGAALTGVEWPGFAPIFGILTAGALVGLGMLPGQELLSVLGSVGLLVNVPWAVSWYFPGEGRAPLLIMVSGALIIAIAVLLTRMSGRFRTDLAPRVLPSPIPDPDRPKEEVT